MWSVINYLNEPRLVAETQKFFGLKILTKVVNNSYSEVNSEREERDVYNHTKSDFHVLGNTVENTCVKKHRSAQNGSLENSHKIISSVKSEHVEYDVNRFWHYLFVVGTALGNEIFYALFFPFWFWNVDGSVGRRVVLVWMIVMYIGQSIKDIVKWPRPSYPPVLRLQKKWAEEYGLPSTHAMVGVSIPFSVIIYTKDRYEYPLFVGLSVAVLWCTLICVSRVYLGMHSVLDIIAGLLLTAFLMMPFVPLVDALDYYIVRSLWSPFFTLSIGTLLITYFPTCHHWTPTRGDTTMIVSVCVGLQVGTWLNYYLGVLSEPTEFPPYSFGWPSYFSLTAGVLRTVIGFVVVFATRSVCKSVSYPFLCSILKVDPNYLRASANSIENKPKTFVDLTRTFLTYFFMGFNIVLLPHIFKFIGIERKSFFTEV